MENRKTVKRLVQAASILAMTAALAGCDQIYSTIPPALSPQVPTPAVPTAVVREGIDAVGDVTVGGTTLDDLGQPVAELTITNQTPDKHDYTVSVAFQYSPGTDLLDIQTVSVLGVEGNSRVRALVRSTRRLTSPSTATITTALRSCPPQT